MKFTRKLLIIGGVLVGFWFSALIQSIFLPSMFLSKIDSVSVTDSGTIIEYSGIVPHMEFILFAGIALLIAGAMQHIIFGEKK